MSLRLSHEQIEELLGAFALDAVDPDEWEVIDLHLRECPRCRAEVTEHREVATLLAHTGASAPDGVWSRILAELEPAAPELRMPTMPTALPAPPGVAAEQDPARSPTDDLARRRSASKKRTRIMSAIVAAAAVIVAVLGIVTVRQSQHLDRVEATLRDVSLDRVATQAMSDPHAATGKLTSGDGRVSAPVVLDAEGKGYLFAAKLPELSSHRIYQLWGKAGRSVVSLGVFDGGTDVVQFEVGSVLRRDLGDLMVTQETAPGVARSTHQPVLTGSV